MHEAQFLASNGEAVRRIDLERAVGNRRVAGIVGQDLARRALAGDRAALDKFHDLVGLALVGVTEHGEVGVVRLVEGPHPIVVEDEP